MIEAVSRGRWVAVAALCALSVGGCMTTRVKPQPSQAVIDARAARVAKVASCTEAIDTAPVDAFFAFQTADLSETGKLHLDAARHALTCKPALVAVVESSADQRGSEAEQAALARQRQAAVIAYLGAGVAPRITTAAAGKAAENPSGDVLVIHAIGQGW
jgi:outer membrane protein OmpA-like peptidoglycan-associated protein